MHTPMALRHVLFHPKIPTTGTTACNSTNNCIANKNSLTWSWLPGIMMTGWVHFRRDFSTLFNNSTLNAPRTCQKSPKKIIPPFRFFASSWTFANTSSQVSIDDPLTCKSEKITHLSQFLWGNGGSIIGMLSKGTNCASLFSWNHTTKLLRYFSQLFLSLTTSSNRTKGPSALSVITSLLRTFTIYRVKWMLRRVFYRPQWRTHLIVGLHRHTQPTASAFLQNLSFPSTF